MTRRPAVIIQFEVKERPVRSSPSRSTGTAAIRTGDITDKILLKKGDLANQTKLQADIEAVKSLYLEKGYTDADVNGELRSRGKGQHRAGGLHVTEGLATTIKEIRFSGNHFASESTLRGLMKTKPQSLFDSGVFQESKLEEDKAAIVAYYTDHGFVDAKIDKVTRDVQTQEGQQLPHPHRLRDRGRPVEVRRAEHSRATRYSPPSVSRELVTRSRERP